MEEGSIAELKDSPAFGVSCDESTDISSVKQLLVFVTFPKAARVECMFLTVVKPEGVIAATISSVLVQVLDEWGVTVE